MDAFYASVELRDHPELRGKPVVVGGSAKGRGVVSTASYEARKYGICSAMSAAKAVRLCPHAIFIRPRMDHYVEVSRHIREIFFRFTPLVEPISLDEAFLDVTGSFQLFGPAAKIALEIKQIIRDELDLPSSAGVAPNKFVAKVASDLKKPDGLVIVEEGKVQSFLDPLPIRRVWGIGPKTEQKFLSLGVTTVAGIRQLPKDSLQRKFGINSDHFWRLSRGLDPRRVVPERDARSISHETTFSADVQEHDCLLSWVQELAGQVAMRMRRLDIKGKTIQLKVRFSDFKTITRSHTFKEHSSSTSEIDTFARLMMKEVLQADQRAVRLVGVGVANLNYDVSIQQTLFDQDEKQKQNRIDETCDSLKQKFGNSAIRPASALQHDIRVRRTATNEDNRNG